MPARLANTSGAVVSQREKTVCMEKLIAVTDIASKINRRRRIRLHLTMRLIHKKLKWFRQQSGLAFHAQYTVYTSGSWTHKHSCTSGSAETTIKTNASCRYNFTVLAASAHVRPFFFLCFSLMFAVGAECRPIVSAFCCLSGNVALVTVQEPPFLPYWVLLYNASHVTDP